MYFRLSGRKKLKAILNRRHLLLLSALVILISFLIAIYGSLVSDKVTNVSVLEAQQVISQAVTNAVELYMKENSLFDERCFTPVYDSNGKVSSYSLNSETVASAENSITAKISKELKKHDTIKVQIPSGSLSDIEFFSGKGFPVTFSSHLSASVMTEPKSIVESVGINHTLYKANIHIQVSCELILNRKSEEFTLEFDKVIAEKVIIGDVPLAN